MFTFAVKQQLF